MLELVDVTKSYPSPIPGGLCVLKDISLKIEQGRSLAIVGPSGCGKSTLLNIIGTLDRPSSGKVLLDGTDMGRLGEIELARIRNENIGFVFQMHHLLPQCTVLENVLIPTLARRKTKWTWPYLTADRRQKKDNEYRERAFDLLQRVNLADRLRYRPGELSMGQRQRVAVVRALINKPALLLADEPTGSLDQNSAGEVTELLVELNQAENFTLIVVTHSPKLAERIGHVMQLTGKTLIRRDEATPQ